MALPRDILRKRLKNEIQLCKEKLSHRVQPRDAGLSAFPSFIDVEMYGIPALAMIETPAAAGKHAKAKTGAAKTETVDRASQAAEAGGAIVSIYNHKLEIEITEEYPYQKPVVRWQTPIFHPNIMSPEDGGYVCTKLLRDWSFSSNLCSFILSLEVLLAHPNPKSPHGTKSCTMAAEYFNKSASGSSGQAGAG